MRETFYLVPLELTSTSPIQAFTERVKAEAAGIPNLEVIVRDTGTSPFSTRAHIAMTRLRLEWASQKGMVGTRSPWLMFPCSRFK